MKRFPLLILICALAAFGLAACGDDNSSSDTTEPAATATTTTDETTTGSAGGGGTVKVAADPDGSLAFVQKSLTAPAGSVTFEFENSSSTAHDFVVAEGDKEIAKTDVISGDKATTKASLDAGGDYVFYCSVPGHRQAGMEGKLTVK